MLRPNNRRKPEIQIKKKNLHAVAGSDKHHNSFRSLSFGVVSDKLLVFRIVLFVCVDIQLSGNYSQLITFDRFGFFVLFLSLSLLLFGFCFAHAVQKINLLRSIVSPNWTICIFR